MYPVGGDHGEALVIDDQKYPDELNEMYEKVIAEIKKKKKTPLRLSIDSLRKKVRKQASKEDQTFETLQHIFNIVYSTLKYDKAKTDALARDYQKIAINKYISRGIGVCRTQAALCAYLAERLSKEDVIEGRASIDRNTFDDSGHAWARFITPSGEVYIIDPAQKYIGKLKDVDRNKSWDYRRSEDLLKEIL